MRLSFFSLANIRQAAMSPPQLFDGIIAQETWESQYAVLLGYVTFCV